MTEQHMSITDVRYGVICQQVNCQGAYGAGVSGTIGRKWPEVSAGYRDFCSGMAPEELFGKIQVIQLGRDLYCANLFAQLNYGNSGKTGLVYTDMDMLARLLRHVSETITLPAYVPYRIGCGLAGGDWNDLCERLADTGIIVCRNK